MLIYLKLLVTAFLWGGTFIAGRLLSGHVTPASAAFLRFFIASVCLVMLTWKTEGVIIPRIEKRQIIPVLLLGLFGVFSYNIFFFKGLEIITAGRASLIIALNPIFISLLSAWFFKEKLNAVKMTGILLSVAGAVTVISKGHLLQVFSQGLGWGELFIFGAVGSWVTFSLIGKTVLSDISPLVSITCSSVVGTIALIIPAVAEGLFSHLFEYALADWASLIFLGVFGTVVGFIWYYEGIKAIGPSRAGLFINFVPISAILLAFLMLDEPITLTLLTGALLVSTGVFLTNYNFQVKKLAPSSV